MTAPVADDWFTPITLTGPGLTLTPLRIDDAPEYLAALGDDEATAEVTAHLSFHAPRTLAETQAHLTQVFATPGRLAYAQRRSGDDMIIGTTSFYEVDPTLRALAIGHTWIGRPYWRTGVNTASKLIMLTRAFEGLGAERIVWHTDVLNLRSQAAIERLRATKEGVLRHHRIRRDGTWRDTVQYSLLSAEWPPVKQRLKDHLNR